MPRTAATSYAPLLPQIINTNPGPAAWSVASLNTNIYIYIYIYIYVHNFINMCTCVYKTYLYVKHVCVHKHVYIPDYIYIYMYICMAVWKFHCFPRGALKIICPKGVGLFEFCLSGRGRRPQFRSR